MSSREQMWSQVPDDVDVAVVGGGIAGAGVARDAARQRWLDAYSAEVALSRRWKERTQIENAP